MSDKIAEHLYDLESVYEDVPQDVDSLMAKVRDRAAEREARLSEKTIKQRAEYEERERKRILASPSLQRDLIEATARALKSGELTCPTPAQERGEMLAAVFAQLSANREALAPELRADWDAKAVIAMGHYYERLRAESEAEARLTPEQRAEQQEARERRWEAKKAWALSMLEEDE